MPLLARENSRWRTSLAEPGLLRRMFCRRGEGKGLDLEYALETPALSTWLPFSGARGATRPTNVDQIPSTQLVAAVSYSTSHSPRAAILFAPSWERRSSNFLEAPQKSA